MRRLPVFLILLPVLAMTTLPALAEGEDPLANSVLLPDTVALAMVGLAILLMVFFVLWTRRGPHH